MLIQIQHFFLLLPSNLILYICVHIAFVPNSMYIFSLRAALINKPLIIITIIIIIIISKLVDEMTP